MTIKKPEKQRKWRTWLPILLFMAGFGSVYLGWKGEMLALIYVGLLPIGLAVAWWGVEAIRTKTSSYIGGDQDSSISYSYVGLAAAADGVLLVLVGILAAGFGVVGLLGFQEKLLAFINQHPGPAIIAGGVGALAFGSTLALGTTEDRRSFWSVLASLPERLVGGLLLILGLLGVLVGSLELISPRHFQLLLSAVRDTLLPGY